MMALFPFDAQLISYAHLFNINVLNTPTLPKGNYMKLIKCLLFTTLLTLCISPVHGMKTEDNRRKPWTFKVESMGNQIVATAHKPDEEDWYGPAQVMVTKNVKDNTFSLESKQLFRFLNYTSVGVFPSEKEKTHTTSDAIEANYPSIIDRLKKQIVVFEEHAKQIAQYPEKLTK